MDSVSYSVLCIKSYQPNQIQVYAMACVSILGIDLFAGAWMMPYSVSQTAPTFATIRLVKYVSLELCVLLATIFVKMDLAVIAMILQVIDVWIVLFAPSIVYVMEHVYLTIIKSVLRFIPPAVLR
jgi:hypothetical protein